MIDIDLGGSRWRLLAQLAAFHAGERLLVVADVHLGKAATFRALGVPLPAAVQHGSTLENLARLTALMETLAPRRLVFLGDLFHAREALAPATANALAQWRTQHATIDMVLVEGNHDARAGAPAAELGVRVVTEPWPAAGVLLAHHPQWCDGEHVLAGHLHPALRINGRADDSARVPCFWIRQRRVIGAGLTVLPAFGEFTGGATLTREPGDRVIAVADDRLLEIPAQRTLAA